MIKKNRKLRTLLLSTAILAAGATIASAAIVAVFGDAVQFTPASVVLNAAQSNVNFAAFDERQCFQLPANLQTDQGWIPANTWVSCEFNHADPAAAAGAFYEGRVRYDRPILGVISTSAGLDASDAICMNGVAYPPAGTEALRGLEAGTPDLYQVIFGGFGLALRFDVVTASDQVRAIIACPGGGD